MNKPLSQKLLKIYLGYLVSVLLLRSKDEIKSILEKPSVRKACGALLLNLEYSNNEKEVITSAVKAIIEEILPRHDNINADFGKYLKDWIHETNIRIRSGERINLMEIADEGIYTLACWVKYEEDLTPVFKHIKPDEDWFRVSLLERITH